MRQRRSRGKKRYKGFGTRREQEHTELSSFPLPRDRRRASHITFWGGLDVIIGRKEKTRKIASQANTPVSTGLHLMDTGRTKQPGNQTEY